MNFLGYDFHKDANAATPYYENNKINSISISSGVYDYLKLSTNYDAYDAESIEWDAHTVILANFNQNLIGGNISYEAASISAVRLKRREAGSFEWTAIYEREINNVAENFNFEYIDKYARGRETEYEYCIVPVIDGVEQNVNIVRCVSDFDGAVISDAEKSYHIELDASVVSTQKNRQCSIVTTIGNKYPFVFFGSDSNYFSGGFSGTALYGGGDSWDMKRSVNYRNELAEWLTNGQPKVLKIFDGRSWLINVNGNVSLSYSDHYDKVDVAFDFVEIGNVNSTEDLYNSGLVNFHYE